MCLEPHKPGEMVLSEAGGMNKGQITEGLLSNEKNVWTFSKDNGNFSGGSYLLQILCGAWVGNGKSG